MRLFMAFLFVALLSCPAWAGFQGPSEAFTSVTTVADATKAGEDVTCILQGNIIGHTAKNRYTFKDATGSIIVDIPPNVFGALEVTPENTVRLTGEIGGKKDPNRLDPHVRVRYLEILQ